MEETRSLVRCRESVYYNFKESDKESIQHKYITKKKWRGERHEARKLMHVSASPNLTKLTIQIIKLVGLIHIMALRSRRTLAMIMYAFI